MNDKNCIYIHTYIKDAFPIRSLLMRSKWDTYKEKRNKIQRGEIRENADGCEDQSHVKRFLKNTSTCAQTFPSSSLSTFLFISLRFSARHTHIPPCRRTKFWRSSFAPKLVLRGKEVPTTPGTEAELSH